MLYNTILEFYNADLASVEKAMKAKLLLGSDYRAEIFARLVGLKFQPSFWNKSS